MYLMTGRDAKMESIEHNIAKILKHMDYDRRERHARDEEARKDRSSLRQLEEYSDKILTDICGRKKRKKDTLDVIAKPVEHNFQGALKPITITKNCQ